MLYSLNRSKSDHEKSSKKFSFSCILTFHVNANESYLTDSAEISLLSALLNVIVITIISVFDTNYGLNSRL